MIEEKLGELTQDLGVAPAEKNEEAQTFGLVIGDVSIDFQDVKDGCVMSSTLMPLPNKKREVLFGYLMHANFLGQGTGGGCIGIDPDEKFLTLSLSIPYEVNYQVFKESVEDFLNFIDYWKGEISSLLEKD